ncbi:HWE histidine kinase domain-containing protein [Shimia ponticola]|uniref:HWE histidine kinase domain-containing protein n=1 Tax=Shimia ponticola TaxID=2582893 RepID=UPI0011BF2E4F|nr:HWE histidine kinase domain-containing protein [Shimia ponticola]
MSLHLTDEQMQEALETCAAEPAHIPGTIQPIGFLLACDVEDWAICQASENSGELFGRPVADLFEETVASLLGSPIWHGLRNAIGTEDFADGRRFLGQYEKDDAPYSVHACKAGARCVLEIEPLGPSDLEPSRERDRALLIQQIEFCSTLTELFETTVELLRHLTGFDRVSIIKFDDQWNGEVLAEARSSLVEPLVGLCFPSHDIPAQARELMRITPLRVIADVSQKPISLLAKSPDESPLDMTHALLRGVSPVHMQYLQNFGVGATMTLSIILKDQLWGYVSFHSVKPDVVPANLRHLLLTFMPILRLKLELIQREEEIRLSRAIDDLQSDVKDELSSGEDLQGMLNRVGPSIAETLDVVGVAMTNGSEYFSFGDVPETAVIDALSQKARQNPSQVLAETALTEALPELSPHLSGFAGALVTVFEDKRCLQVFRREISDKIHWAGNPSKTVEVVESKLRIQPRNSFSTYLEEVRGKSKPWSEDDLHLMRQLWPLLSAAERQSFLADLTRQQNLMINELNHRVRNILSLIKSVSTQARRAGGSLESYSHALEARIFALAAAHNIGAGSAQTAVSVRRIIELEAAPHVEENSSQMQVLGTDAEIRADSAPIFGLVIHELITNAVKYGALSTPYGRLEIQLGKTDDGLKLSWKESGGPSVVKPEAFGFGTTLIQQAVPYEMGGTADVVFAPTGLEARIVLPGTALSSIGGDEKPNGSTEDTAPASNSNSLKERRVMVLEDNFMIARELKQTLLDVGFADVEMVPNVRRAVAYLEQVSPGLALLDVNLSNGETSFKVADELLARRIPFLFVTGYGEQHNFPGYLKEKTVLTKPVTDHDLIDALNSLAGEMSDL